MSRKSSRLRLVLVSLFVPLVTAAAGPAADEGWIDLMDSPTFDAWKPPTGASDPRRRRPARSREPPRAAGRAGHRRHLQWAGRADQQPDHQGESTATSRRNVEFAIAKGSNSGVKLGGVYEIQILDSYGKTKLTGNGCGGIYPAHS